MVKHDEILEAISSRSTWEERQATWYQMRHDGLRRRVKPFPNAADMHFPMVDMQIEKLKPVYVQQIFATDVVATFVALDTAVSPFQSAAAGWFDYKLKQETNFEEEITSGVDTMLQGGKGVVKIYWDTTEKCVCFDSIEPRFLIVPKGTIKLAKADWIVHVQHFSKCAYARRDDFKQDEAFIKSICGKGDESNTQRAQTEKEQREGLTCGKGDDDIVIWEVYSREKDGRWLIKTYSPVRPTEEVRPQFGLPYNKGRFAKKIPPFGELNCEIKDKGYYASRGISEKLAPFEASLNKDWNTQKDHQTQTCQPVFQAPDGLPQGQQNVRMIPGQVLPFKIEAITFPPMPGDIGMQMQMTRMTGEQLIATPDFGAVQNPGQKPRTATEMNQVAGVAGQSQDLRSRIFRRELGYILQLAWSLYIQYAEDSLTYYFNEELGQLPKEAFSDKYLIEPSGSGDNLNRPLVLQRAVNRFQMFKGDPNIEQRELAKSVLEADDPRLVKRLLLNAGTQAAQQIEDQAQEISIMLLGFPAEVRETDDDAAHVQSLVGFVQRRNQLGEPLTPEHMRIIALHGKTHMQAMKKKNPQGFQQHMQQSAPLFQELENLAGQVEQAKQMQQQQAQGGMAPVVPMTAGGAQ